MRKFMLALCGLVALSMSLTACMADGQSKKDSAYHKVTSHSSGRAPYVPHNDVEFGNYNNAQKLYDSPSTIVWCTTTWGNASAPLVTVPVAGKLTSSTTSYFPPEHVDDQDNWGLLVPSQSVDGMYHPNPPQYRYGFTPGGQYVDFFQMPTLCTTAVTKFQRQATKISVSLDRTALAAQRRAEVAMRAGDKHKAQAILAGALG